MLCSPLLSRFRILQDKNVNYQKRKKKRQEKALVFNQGSNTDSLRGFEQTLNLLSLIQSLMGSNPGSSPFASARFPNLSKWLWLRVLTSITGIMIVLPRRVTLRSKRANSHVNIPAPSPVEAFALIPLLSSLLLISFILMGRRRRLLWRGCPPS